MNIARIKEMIGPDMEQVELTIQKALFAESEALEKLIDHVSLFSGKRLRPALVLLVSKAMGRTTEDHFVLGAVVELIHTASLIHDDILDNATMRRRVASVNHLYGNEVPILLGDLIYARAFALSLTLSTPEASKVLAEVTETVCSGEIEQIFQRGRFDLAESDYFSIIQAKTASLYAASCRLAAVYSDADVEEAAAFERFGMALGTAFQIVDDCLDITGEEDVVGKSLGTDMEEGKITLPLIHLAATLPDEGRKRLKEVFLSDSIKGKSDVIAAEFDLQASVNHAFGVADEYISRAIKELSFFAPSQTREALEGMAEFVLHRKL